MRIAAFDLGTTWACAHNLPSAPVAYVWWGKKEGARPQKLGACTLDWGNLLTMFSHHGLEVVVYERPFARGQAATRMLWGMAGILEGAAHNAGLPILDITPAEIKKWAASNGHATKGDMMDAAIGLGYAGDNEHEADAYCLLKFAEATLTKESA